MKRNKTLSLAMDLFFLFSLCMTPSLWADPVAPADLQASTPQPETQATASPQPAGTQPQQPVVAETSQDPTTAFLTNGPIEVVQATPLGGGPGHLIAPIPIANFDQYHAALDAMIQSPRVFTSQNLININGIPLQTGSVRINSLNNGDWSLTLFSSIEANQASQIVQFSGRTHAPGNAAIDLTPNSSLTINGQQVTLLVFSNTVNENGQQYITITFFGNGNRLGEIRVHISQPPVQNPQVG